MPVSRRPSVPAGLDRPARSPGEARIEPAVDTADDPSVSFAALAARTPEGRTGHTPPGSTRIGATMTPGLIDRAPGIPVMSGRSVGVRLVSGFPIQASKVRRPILRPDTLSRERLNSWLDAHSDHRLILIVAEAGYGKTTLLADWTAHTTRRVLWYRLDPDDRDWVAFMHYLVASGREHVPDFASETERLLASIGPGGPTREQITATLSREFAQLADGNTTLILDDLHAIDSNPEVTSVLRSLIATRPAELAVILSGRVLPLGPAKRDLGTQSVARLTALDLRFRTDEVDRLFSLGTAPLEPDVLEDLAARTEGWVASLNLVRTALADRPDQDARQFVRSLNGAKGEVHDYLAEEVLGHLPDEVRQLLLRAALLEVVTLEQLEVAYPEALDTIARLMNQAVAVDLLAPTGDSARYRFHPLVRDFLVAKARSELPHSEVRRIHERLAAAFEGRDWRVSATHYAHLGQMSKVWEIVNSAVGDVLASGEYWPAAELLRSQGSEPAASSVLMLQSRLHSQRGDMARSLSLAESAAAVEDGAPPVRAEALLNLAGLLLDQSSYMRARDIASQALVHATGDVQMLRARATLAVADQAELGSTVDFIAILGALADQQRLRRQWHHLAITELNLAIAENWMLSPDASLRHSADAEALLKLSSDGYQSVSVVMARATSLAMLGRWSDAERSMQQGLRARHSAARSEAVQEAADIYLWYGPLELAKPLLDEAAVLESQFAPMLTWSQLWYAVSRSDPSEAQELVPDDHATRLNPTLCGRFQTLLGIGRLENRVSGPPRWDATSSAARVAQAQRARLPVDLSALLGALSRDSTTLSSAIQSLDPLHPAIAVLADDLVRHLDSMTPAALETLKAAIVRRPERWLPTLRHDVTYGTRQSTSLAMLGEIGDADDIGLITRTRTSIRQSVPAASAARRLARRFAPRLRVRDMGLVHLEVGNRVIHAADVRRKALSLLCFVAAQPSMSATRDQILDALWPEQDPAAAGNSLNQTAYFLRRTIDPDYRAGISAEYVHLGSETAWIDAELVEVDSHVCNDTMTRFIKGLASVEEVIEAYGSGYALEFTYEPWAEAVRGALQSAYLMILERDAAERAARGDHVGAIGVLRHAIAADPLNETLGAALQRVLSAAGARAAAELHARYGDAVEPEDR